MYKVLVAEDEGLVRKGLVALVEQMDEDFCICGCAANGAEALAIAQETRPDIIITDIMMPHMDGIEMLEQYCPQDPGCKVIIVSGHSEFDYAQKAVRLGVEDFLLKPIVPEEIRELLFQLKDRLDKAKNFLKNIENLRRIEQESLPLLRERFLQTLLDGSAVDRKEQQRLQLAFTGRYYCVTFLKVLGERPDLPGDTGRSDMIQMFLAKVSETIFAPEIEVYPCVAYRRDICLISCIDCEGQNTAFSILNRKLQGLCGSFHKHLDIAICAASGTICSDLQDIRRCRQQAEYALDFTFSGMQVVNYEETTLSGESVVELPTGLMDGLFLNIKLSDQQKALEYTRRIFSRYSEHTPTASSAVKLEVLDILFRLFQYLDHISADVSSLQEKRSVFYDKMEKCGNVEQLQQVFEEFIGLCCKHFERMRLSRCEVTVEKICHYVDTHYGDSSLNLDQVASTLFMSANYLRQIFKSTVGEPFGEYLTRVRMNHAAQLLQESERKVQDIAALVGYDNPQYFGICFKKYHGLTPTDFRDIHPAAPPASGASGG